MTRMANPAPPRFRLLASAYSGAHYGKSLFWYMTELLFGFYLAEIYELRPGTIGGLLAAFLLWDAISDPLLGLVFARYRVSTRALLNAQLAGACLSAVTFWLVFWKPPLNETGLTIYALLVGLAFRTAYTVFDVPQNTLLPRIATNRNERLMLSSLRTGCSAVASLTVSLASAVILLKKDTAEQANGFAFAAALFVCVTLGTTFILSRIASSQTDQGPSARQPPTHALRLIFSDPVLVSIFGAIFFLSTGWPLFGKLVPFFAGYVREAPAATGTLLTAMTLSALLSQPLWILAGRQMGRQTLLFIALATMMSGASIFGLFGQTQAAASLVGIVLMAAANSALSLLTWTALADRLSHLKSAHVNDVLAFGVFTFASKLALSVGGLTLGGTLIFIGYETNMPLAEDDQRHLTLIMAAGPALTAMLAVACLVAPHFRRRTQYAYDAQ